MNNCIKENTDERLNVKQEVNLKCSESDDDYPSSNYCLELFDLEPIKQEDINVKRETSQNSLLDWKRNISIVSDAERKSHYNMDHLTKNDSVYDRDSDEDLSDEENKKRRRRRKNYEPRAFYKKFTDLRQLVKIKKRNKKINSSTSCNRRKHDCIKIVRGENDINIILDLLPSQTLYID